MVDQKLISLYALQIDYLNLDNLVKDTEGENFDHSKCINCVEPHPTEKCVKKQGKGNINKKISSSFNSRNPKDKFNEGNNKKPNM